MWKFIEFKNTGKPIDFLMKGKKKQSPINQFLTFDILS